MGAISGGRKMRFPGLASVVPAAVALAGLCVSATGAHSEDLPPPPLIAGVPIPAGRIEAAIGQLDGVVEDVMARTGVPGIAVAVVHDGSVALAQGFGLRRTGEPAEVTPDTVFQIASLSKPVGATVVAHEVGRGNVTWDTAMSDLLPWFALSDPRVTAMLTVGDLYAHRSGLPDQAGDDLEDIGFDRQTVLERLRYLPSDGFRDVYAYTNFGLTAAAAAVADRAGTDWASLSEQALYEPLGMEGTSSRFADFLARENRASGHVMTDDGYRPDHQRQPDAQSPAGGVSSTASDMARWMLMVLGDGTLDGTEIAPLTALLPAVTPQAISRRGTVPAARTGFYGYGFGVGDTPAGRVQLSHSGAFAMGAATNFVMIPSAGVGIVVLSNAAPVGAVEAIGETFADLVQFGEVSRDWLAAFQPLFAPMMAPVGRHAGEAFPPDPAPARAPEAYAGRYRNDYFGTVSVAVRDSGLVLSAGPADIAFDLRHWSGDGFVFEVASESAPDGSRSAADFAMGPDGVAESLTVEIWDDNGMGTLVRE